MLPTHASSAKPHPMTKIALVLPVGTAITRRTSTTTAAFLTSMSVSVTRQTPALPPASAMHGSARAVASPTSPTPAPISSTRPPCQNVGRKLSRSLSTPGRKYVYTHCGNTLLQRCLPSGRPPGHKPVGCRRVPGARQNETQSYATIVPRAPPLQRHHLGQFTRRARDEATYKLCSPTQETAYRAGVRPPRDAHLQFIKADL